MRVVGAGLSRTGTVSLSVALGRLLGAPVYHGGSRARDVVIWEEATRRPPIWDSVLGGFCAVLDWPPAAFWRELAGAYPDAFILLSTRDPDDWWRSADDVIFRHVRGLARRGERHRFAGRLRDFFSARFCWPLEEAAAKRAYAEHNERVRTEVPPERLIDWRLGDGWEPLCRALGLPVPAAPFPHENRRRS